MTKSISIVIPVFNDEAHLKDCLQAIAGQTVAPDEVIVVDNNSDDSSADVAASFPFVMLMKEPVQGIVHARNTGFNSASCQIIGRIDSDTVLPRDWVARVGLFYDDENHANHALTGGGYFYNMRFRRFNGWIQSQFAYRVNRFIAGHYVLWGSNMALPAAIWRKVRASTCDRDDIHEDLDLSFHLHDSGAKITYKSSLRAGVFLKRVRGDRSQLHYHMQRWPVSLRVHGYRLWWLGVVGNIFLWYIVQPFGYCVEYSDRLLNRPPPYK